MTVALVQMDIAWGDTRANIRTAERLMLSAARSDLYVLPEMWNTGVNPDPRSLPLLRFAQAQAEAPCPLQWMQQMADRLDAAVAGSMAVSLPDGTYRNRLYFARPATSPEVEGRESNCQPCQQSLPPRGEVWRGAFYDKHHLFSYGGETEHFTPGQEQVTVEWRGVRFRLSVCYDLRFPLWLRNRDDYDALICVASWPSVRMHAWKVLLQARAIENQCYVLGVNRIGHDPYCDYSGGTSLVDPFGQPTSCPDHEASVLTQTLDLKRLRSFRRKFPVLEEMDAIPQVLT